MEHREKRVPHWAWIILAVCFVNLFINYSIRLGYGVVLPEMIRALGLSRTQGGAIFNGYLAVYICLTPFVGNLTDRLGARRVITFFCLLLGTGTFLMGTADGFWTAGLFFALAGAGASAMWTPVITVVQRWFAPDRRGMALGVLSMGYGLGFASMGWLFPILAESFSWRYCWYALGLSSFVLVLANGALLRSKPEDARQLPWGTKSAAPVADIQPSDPAGRAGYGTVFRSRAFWIIGLSYLFVACALYIITTFMVDYADMELGFTYKEASFLATIHGLFQVLGVLTLPLLSDRIGRRRTLICCCLLIAVGMMGVIASGRNLLALYASIAFLAVFYGAIWPLYGACGGDYFRKEVMGTVIGSWTPFYGMGAISAHFLAGRIRDLTETFQGAFVLSMIFSLVAAILMWRAPKLDPARGGA